MTQLRVAATALNQTPLAWDSNAANIVEALREARGAGATLVAFPELALSGYGCEDAFLAPHVRRTAFEMLLAIAPETRGLVATVGLPVEHERFVYNAVACLVDGRVVGIGCKRVLADDGIHYEPRWFRAWPTGARAEIQTSVGKIPIGDLTFDISGVRVALEICEEAWVEDRLSGPVATSSADVVINPSASHFAFAKHERRRQLASEGARLFGAAYVYVNLLGNESGRAIYDGDAIIATPRGGIEASAERFRHVDRSSVVRTLDISEIRANRHTSRAAITSTTEVSVDLSWPSIEPERAPTPQRPAWEVSPDAKAEELARAVGLGLVDYLRKSRSRGFVISLSGGADSSAVACLAAIGLEHGVQEHGLAEFAARVGVPDTELPASKHALIERLVATAYQSTAQSSQKTRAAATAVARDVGTSHVEIDVEPIVDAYLSRVGVAVGRPLSWTTDDLALQNIQARVRSPGIWLLANLRGALLLTTGNRSEAAVGYATMDGDTSGGLAPIAGVDKTYLRTWLKWLERAGPRGLRPFPALAYVNALAPTAELRPASARQTDEGDLMPYPILDAIERSAIRDRRSPRETFDALRKERSDLDARYAAACVTRFFELWSRSQWKRERLAPSFHLDDQSVDPKTWCRFPILSGGFVRELAELAAYGERRLKVDAEHEE